MADRKKLVRTFMAKSEDFNCSSDSSLGLDDASSDEYHPSLSDESSGDDTKPPSSRRRKKAQTTNPAIVSTAPNPSVSSAGLDPGVLNVAQDPASITVPVEPQKKRRRRNHGNPREWKKNIRKEKRIRGETYISATGVEVHCLV